MLHLPDVAELVRDQALVDIGAAQKDHEVRGEAVEAAPRPELEQPGRYDEPHMPDADGPWPPVESVEPRFGSYEARVAQPAQAMGSSTRTAERSWACVYWNW